MASGFSSHISHPPSNFSSLALPSQDLEEPRLPPPARENKGESMQRPSQNPPICFPLLSHCSTQAGCVPDKQEGRLHFCCALCKGSHPHLLPKQGTHPALTEQGRGRQTLRHAGSVLHLFPHLSFPSVPAEQRSLRLTALDSSMSPDRAGEEGPERSSPPASSFTVY